MIWKKLLVIGDSNSQFGFSEKGVWLSMLSDRLQRRCDIINRGFSGYNTRHMKILTPKILSEFSKESIGSVILLLGSNDSASNDLSPVQHVPLDEYKANMKNIIDSVLNHGVCKEHVIVITPPRIDEVKWAKALGEKSAHYDHLVKDYARSCFELCQELNLKCIDLNNLMQTPDYEKYLFDGLHFSSLGGKLLVDNLYPILDKLFIQTNKLEFNFPYWKDLENRPDMVDMPQFSNNKSS